PGRSGDRGDGHVPLRIPLLLPARAHRRSRRGTGGTRVASSERDGDPRVRLPQLRLDELLEELQGRIDAARGTRDRVHSLLEAVLSVGRELDLEQVLHSIVDAAAALRSEEHTSELQSRENLVCRLLLEKK